MTGTPGVKGGGLLEIDAVLGSEETVQLVVEALEAVAEDLLVSGGHLPTQHCLLPTELVEGRAGDLGLLIDSVEGCLVLGEHLPVLAVEHNRHGLPHGVQGCEAS